MLPRELGCSRLLGFSVPSGVCLQFFVSVSGGRAVFFSYSATLHSFFLGLLWGLVVPRVSPIRAKNSAAFDERECGKMSDREQQFRHFKAYVTCLTHENRNDLNRVLFLRIRQADRGTGSGSPPRNPSVVSSTLFYYPFTGEQMQLEPTSLTIRTILGTIRYTLILILV